MKSKQINLFQERHFITWKLYFLLCENNVIYIGITRRFKVENRIKKHIRGKGAVATKFNKPIKLLKVIDTTQLNQSIAARNYENRAVSLCTRLCKNHKIMGGNSKIKPIRKLDHDDPAS
jgi:predicted GIY-YIG superfamily endonuclease